MENKKPVLVRRLHLILVKRLEPGEEKMRRTRLIGIIGERLGKPSYEECQAIINELWSYGVIVEEDKAGFKLNKNI